MSTGSSFGKIFNLTTFGESHGKAIGGIIQGVPANIEVDVEKIQLELDRRRPGQSSITTQRKELDEIQFLSGIFDGKTTGTPIGFLIQNSDAKSKDYSHIKDVFRPSHADFTYEKKYEIRDYRGGGRSSARETACRVVAGAIAKQILSKKEISITAFVDQVGSIKVHDIKLNEIEGNIVRCPNNETAQQMQELIESIKKNGDTIGGSVRCIIENCPIGLGEPIFDKLHAELGKAMLSINAVKGFEIGSGFNCIEMKGSEHNDEFLEGGLTKTNYSGGIQGGISNGMPIDFRVAFKPVATIISEQNSIDSEGNTVKVAGKGRHDPCVVPRAVPIVESMTAIILLDMLLRQQAVHLA